jgi:hypothetical protein
MSVGKTLLLRRIRFMNGTNPSPAAALAEPSQGLKETSARDERLELIRTFQLQAMQRVDPLAANLAVINGDLMHFVYRLRQSLDQGLTGSQPDSQHLARQAELLLRCVRQVDRLAQLDRQLAQAAEPHRAVS